MDGSSSTFAFVSGPAMPSLTSPRVYRMSKVTQPGSNQVTTYSYNADGTPAQILAPKPSTSTVCDATTWSPGCRALQLTYAAGKVTKVTIKTTDGAGTVRSVDAACYAYDGSGRLAQTWDPRITGTACGSPILSTGYTYDPSGRIATVTPPGLAGWTISYDTQGRVDTVSRTHNAANGGGTESTTVRYDVPIGATGSGDESHPDLSAGRVAGWAQTDLPVTATAVFGPGDTVSTTDLRDGEVHGLNVNGREVNTAGFAGTGQAGWKISTTEYDTVVNEIRLLSAANRDTALTGDPTTVGLPAGTSTTAFAGAGHPVDLRRGRGRPTRHLRAAARRRVRRRLGERPAAQPHQLRHPRRPGTDPTLNGPKHAVIQSTVAASLSPATTPTNETDVRTTRTAYGLPGDSSGWTHKQQPMRVTTVVPGGTDVVRETVYNPATGLTTQSRMPNAAGSATAVGATTTTYYTAGTRNDAGCVNSAWINLVCKTQPASQPTTAGLPKLPVTWTTYDWLGRPTTVTETVVDAAGAIKTRTSTTEYENAGWSPRPRRTLTTGTVGTAVPAVITGYHPATGLTTTVSADTTPAPGPGMAGSTSTTYDDFGRVTPFTDADAAATLASYTPTAGSAPSPPRPPGGAVLAATSYGYNAGTERERPTGCVSDRGGHGVGIRPSK